MARETANPYSPPEDKKLRVGGGSSLGSVVLMVALGLLLSVRSFRAAVYLAALSPWEALRQRALPLTRETLELSWALTWPLLVFAVVSFCIWIYRANRAARSLGAQEMVFTPGWAAAISFIPVANLLGPYRAVKEIYQASDRTARDTAWRSSSVSFVLPLWWGVWVFSLVWNVIPYGSFSESSAVWGQAVLETLRATAAALLIRVVWMIERRQAAAHALGSDHREVQFRPEYG